MVNDLHVHDVHYQQINFQGSCISEKIVYSLALIIGPVVCFDPGGTQRILIFLIS